MGITKQNIQIKTNKPHKRKHLNQTPYYTLIEIVYHYYKLPNPNIASELDKKNH
jgi:hypothetical protein